MNWSVFTLTIFKEHMSEAKTNSEKDMQSQMILINISQKLLIWYALCQSVSHFSGVIALYSNFLYFFKLFLYANS